MGKPVFVVLKKYFYSVGAIDTPFTSDGDDILLFNSFEDAKVNALAWCGRWARKVYELVDYGVLSEIACQHDNLVLQSSGSDCYDKAYSRVVVEIYQKYVL